MNASTHTGSSLARSPARKFGWLLRREYWENRGGFFWAPVIAGIVICALSLLGALAGSLHISGMDKPRNLNVDLSETEFARQMGFIGDGGLDDEALVEYAISLAGSPAAQPVPDMGQGRRGEGPKTSEADKGRAAARKRYGLPDPE